MSFFTGTITYGSTGSKTISCGFPPQVVEIIVGARASTTETNPRESVGWSDGTNQFYHSRYDDSTGRQQKAGNDRIVSQWERVSGTLTEVLRVNFTSFSGNDVNLNVATASSSYQLYVKVWG